MLCNVNESLAPPVDTRSFRKIARSLITRFGRMLLDHTSRFQLGWIEHATDSRFAATADEDGAATRPYNRLAGIPGEEATLRGPCTPLHPHNGHSRRASGPAIPRF
jgi:hypothetical protein